MPCSVSPFFHTAVPSTERTQSQRVLFCNFKYCTVNKVMAQHPCILFVCLFLSTPTSPVEHASQLSAFTAHSLQDTMSADNALALEDFVPVSA